MESLDGNLQHTDPNAQSDEMLYLHHPAEDPFLAEALQGSSVAVPAGDGGSGSFDCNICLELAQDPVVTMCGHLFCWPCLYRWLEVHSISKECPVCKAATTEETLIPLYGRGKIGSADPRTKPVSGISIPQRPAGQRPDSILRSSHRPYQNFIMGNPNSTTSAGSAGNVTLSAGLGLFPSLLGFQFNSFPDNNAFSGTVYSTPNGLHGPTSYYPLRYDQQQEAFLHRVFLFFLCFVIVCLIFF